jgi:hypothetical protein
MIADEFDIGYDGCGITDVGAAGNRSIRLDHGNAWCYTVADGEGF